MTHPDLAPAPVSIGRFRVQGTLGCGASHVLYQATDTRTGAQVALKCGLPGRAQPDLEPSLKREWGAAQRLSHPGIQRVLEMAEAEEVGTYLVLESLEGMSLAALLAQGIPTFQGLHLMVQLAHTLEAAEREGHLHGDLRPENLWLSSTGTLLVLGFGSAGWSGADPRPAPATGTAHWAPELHRGEAPSPGSEMFAFAVTAFQVLTGRLPYGKLRAGSPGRTESSAELQFPVDMPKSLQRVFSKALDPLPENRYASLHAFISVLIAASPLDEDRLESLLAFMDGAPVPINVADLLHASPVEPLPPPVPEPPPVPVPSVEAARTAGALDAKEPQDPPNALKRLEGLLSDFPGVQEFAIYSPADALEAASQPCRNLLDLAPSFYFLAADAVPASEPEAPVRTITLKSQQRGSLVMLKLDDHSVALLLKPGKTPKGLLEELRTLRSTQT